MYPLTSDISETNPTSVSQASDTLILTLPEYLSNISQKIAFSQL